MHGNYRKAQGSWERFKAERDTHRMHHRRVAQEKNKLITDLKRLQKVCASIKTQDRSFVVRVYSTPSVVTIMSCDVTCLQHYSQYEPTIRQLRKKFDEVSKEKVLIIIQKDRLQAKVRSAHA